MTTSQLRMEKAVEVGTLIELQHLGRKVGRATMGGRTFERHVNPDGSVGGFVESTAYADSTVYVGRHALVLEDAKASGDATLLDYSRLFGSAWARNSALLRGHSKAFGHAVVRGSAELSGRVRAYGNTDICELARMGGESHAYGNSRIHGSARMGGSSRACENSEIAGQARIEGRTRLARDARITEGFVLIGGETSVE